MEHQPKQTYRELQLMQRERRSAWLRERRRKRGPKLPKGTRLLVIERDKSTCGICGLTVELHDIHVDHIIPVSKGGTNALDNLRVTHSRCNLKKGARLQNGNLD